MSSTSGRDRVIPAAAPSLAQGLAEPWGAPTTTVARQNLRLAL